MLGCKPGDSPIDPKHNLGTIVDSAIIDKGQY